MPPSPRPGLAAEDRAERWPDASVILLIHNPDRYEATTVDLVRAQRYAGRVVLRVIDSSTDTGSRWNRAIRDVADEWEAIAPGAFGHGRTRNQALDATTTPIVAYLSQDAQPATEGWLESLVRPLVDGRADAAYGRQLSPAPDLERDATFTYLYPTSRRRFAPTCSEPSVSPRSGSSKTSAWRSDSWTGVTGSRTCPKPSSITHIRWGFGSSFLGTGR
jgi:glycosyltransferase involved in cell wall biosynthesis